MIYDKANKFNECFVVAFFRLWFFLLKSVHHFVRLILYLIQWNETYWRNTSSSFASFCHRIYSKREKKSLTTSHIDVSFERGISARFQLPAITISIFCTVTTMRIFSQFYRSIHYNGHMNFRTHFFLLTRRHDVIFLAFECFFVRFFLRIFIAIE